MEVRGDQGRGGQGRPGKAKGSQGRPGKGGRRPEDKKVIFNERETKRNQQFFERDSKVEFEGSRRSQGRSG